MNLESWIPFLTIGATLLLVLTSLLNFSVFVRQLRASRAQLRTAQRQLENSRQQPVRSAGQGDALQMAKYGLENARILPITAERTG